MLSSSLKKSLSDCSVLVQKRMTELLPNNFSDSRLVDAMRYSALSDGKRIRPFLLIASAKIFEAPILNSLNVAVALEFIHNYSLIHDDLPAMDNDDIRRGKPACHKKFDEATAILAGDALLTYAFELLASFETHPDSVIRCELIRIIAKASGFMGMVGGQMIDLEKSGKKISKEELARLHRLKTGELFMAAAECGAILGCANTEERNALRYFSHDLGLAFQIKDDILDYRGVDCKKIKLDEAMHKKLQENTSIVDAVGIEAAQEQLRLLHNQSINHLKIFDSRASQLIELTEFVVNREK